MGRSQMRDGPKEALVGAHDGCGTVVVDLAWYEHEIRRLQTDLATTRQGLAEAKIAVGWARDVGREEASPTLNLMSEGQISPHVVAILPHAIRAVRSLEPKNFKGEGVRGSDCVTAIGIVAEVAEALAIARYGKPRFRVRAGRQDAEAVT